MVIADKGDLNARYKEVKVPLHVARELFKQMLRKELLSYRRLRGVHSNDAANRVVCPSRMWKCDTCLSGFIHRLGMMSGCREKIWLFREWTSKRGVKYMPLRQYDQVMYYCPNCGENEQDRTGIVRRQKWCFECSDWHFHDYFSMELWTDRWHSTEHLYLTKRKMYDDICYRDRHWRRRI